MKKTKISTRNQENIINLNEDDDEPETPSEIETLPHRKLYTESNKNYLNQNENLSNNQINEIKEFISQKIEEIKKQNLKKTEEMTKELKKCYLEIENLKKQLKEFKELKESKDNKISKEKISKKIKNNYSETSNLNNLIKSKIQHPRKIASPINTRSNRDKKKYCTPLRQTNFKQKNFLQNKTKNKKFFESKDNQPISIEDSEDEREGDIGTEIPFKNNDLRIELHEDENNYRKECCYKKNNKNKIASETKIYKSKNSNELKYPCTVCGIKLAKKNQKCMNCKYLK